MGADEGGDMVCAGVRGRRPRASADRPGIALPGPRTPCPDQIERTFPERSSAAISCVVNRRTTLAADPEHRSRAPAVRPTSLCQTVTL